MTKYARVPVEFTETSIPGEISYDIAEVGIEDALIKLLRDPDYSGGTISLGTDTADVTIVASDSSYTINSRGTTGNFTRSIEVVASYSGALRITSWKEL